LRAVSELLLEDIISAEALRPQFYRECYCDTGALSRDALVSQRILESRYAALFGAAEDAPRLEPAAKAGAEPSLSNQILTEALARRPIVRYLLEGSVRKAGNRVRITGQLIEAETGAHLWADRFDGL